jgi:hypothetical protein
MQTEMIEILPRFLAWNDPQQERLGWMQFRAEGLTQCLTMFR